MLEAESLAALFEDRAQPGAAKRIPFNPYKELRYLVVDDQAASRQSLKLCIQSMGGFAVDQADTINAAYHRIRGQMPDVIRDPAQGWPVGGCAGQLCVHRRDSPISLGSCRAGACAATADTA